MRVSAWGPCIFLKDDFLKLFMLSGGDKNLLTTYDTNRGRFRCFEQFKWMPLLLTLLLPFPIHSKTPFFIYIYLSGSIYFHSYINKNAKLGNV